MVYGSHFPDDFSYLPIPEENNNPQNYFRKQARMGTALQPKQRNRKLVFFVNFSTASNAMRERAIK
jgi:hypothetical protein